jgi:hypothetical protein
MEREQICTHVPFSQLPPEVHFFLWLGCSCSVYALYPWGPTRAELIGAMKEIWDRERFAPDDAADLAMSGRLTPLLRPYAERSLGRDLLT